MAAPSSDHEPFVFYDIILMVAGSGSGGNGELCGETNHLISGGGGGGGGATSGRGHGGYGGGRIHVTGGSSQATGHRGHRSALATDHEPFVFYDIILMAAGGGHGGGGSGGSIWIGKKGYDAYMAKSDSSSSSARGKKGYDAYMSRGDRGSRAASKDKVKFKAGADLSKKVN